jgi:hypothetical protein
MIATMAQRRAILVGTSYTRPAEDVTEVEKHSRKPIHAIYWGPTWSIYQPTTAIANDGMKRLGKVNPDPRKIQPKRSLTWVIGPAGIYVQEKTVHELAVIGDY